MKKIIFALSVLPLFLPVFTGAQINSMMNFSDLKTGSEMMRSIEDKALGEEIHKEMENLMTKMMSGEMTEEETNRMVELMNQYPGPQSIMMGRMMAGQMMVGNFNQGWGMMGYNNMMGPGGFWPWAIFLNSFVWLLVGIFAIIWFWKKISK